MQDDVVSPRTVIAVFVALAVVAALVVGLVVVVYIGPSSSTHRTAVHSTNSISHEVPIPGSTPPSSSSASPPRSSPASPTGEVDWTSAVTSVGAIVSAGTNLVAVLTEPTPSTAGFQAACSKLARQPVPNPPAGSGGDQLSSLQAVASDDAALVHDCETTFSDAVAHPSNETAVADGQNIGRDLVAMRYDAANFYLAIGYSGGDQKSDVSALSEWTFAREIGFQQSDFPAGTVGVPDAPGGPDHTSPVPASTPCSPVHSQPFVADYDSQTYDPSGIGNDYVSSEVLIMPPDDARTALQAIGAPGYDTTCFQPGFDADTRSMTPTTSCGTFTFIGSSISQLPSIGFPVGSVVDRYAANMSCTANGQSGTWYTDLISARVGSAFIQGTFNSFQAPLSTQIEQSAMNAMATRANTHSSGAA
jgi:hypothetical protein